MAESIADAKHVSNTYSEYNLLSLHRYPNFSRKGFMSEMTTFPVKVEPSLISGQPELPEWVYNGAILGVQASISSLNFFLGKLK